MVKAAEAEAESKFLQGQGMARQRQVPFGCPSSSSCMVSYCNTSSCSKSPPDSVPGVISVFDYQCTTLSLTRPSSPASETQCETSAPISLTSLARMSCSSCSSLSKTTVELCLIMTKMMPPYLMPGTGTLTCSETSGQATRPQRCSFPTPRQYLGTSALRSAMHSSRATLLLPLNQKATDHHRATRT
jgi:hypothetical protein